MGISLASLLARTREQDAALDDVALDEVRARCLAALEHARLARWPRTQVLAENVIVTWEGNVVWLGFTEPGEVPVSLTGAQLSSESGGEGARTLAGVVAQLFPEEHAAEMSLREEVTLWTRVRPRRSRTSDARPAFAVTARLSPTGGKARTISRRWGSGPRARDND